MNTKFDLETENCSNYIHFDSHVRAIGRRNSFINHEVIAPLHYRLSSYFHSHVVEVWFDGGFWVNHITNGVKFYVGSLTNLRSALATIRDYCF